MRGGKRRMAVSVPTFAHAAKMNTDHSGPGQRGSPLSLGTPSQAQPNVSHRASLRCRIASRQRNGGVNIPSNH